MSKDRNLEEIDVLKLVFYVLAFLLISLSFVMFLIVPSIKDYKKAKAQYHSKMLNQSRIEQIFFANANDLDALKTKNAKSLNAIINTFDEKKFQNKAGEFFSDVRLNRMPKEDENSTFINYELNVTAMMSTPDKFYAFIDFVNNYENVILIDFPVAMRANSGKIDTSFKIKVLEAKEKI